MGVEERKFNYIPKKENIPGPANYENALPGHTRAYSILRSDPKREQLLTKFNADKIPGPGSYELSKNYKKYDWGLQRFKALRYKELRKPKMRQHSEFNKSNFKYAESPI